MEHNQNTYIIKMDTETLCSEDKCRLLHQLIKKKVLFLQKRAVLAVVERLFWQLGRTLVAVAVVERFKQEVMYGLSAGTKKKWPL